VIADSVNEKSVRITTFLLIFPRIVLAEFNTHRVFSRNSASSRAIPFKKMLKMVKEKPFIPIRWMAEHKGMQGTTYINSKFKLWLLIKLWLLARDVSIIFAKLFSYLGLTKQIVNRLLEPFMYHQVIVTSTDYENFFSLRAEEHAEIHIQELAYEMLYAYNSSKPKLLKKGEWHIAFDGDWIQDELDKLLPFIKPEDIKVREEELQKLKIKIASARCARLSYQTLGTDAKIDYKQDIALVDRLSSSGHFSPFEHCAENMDDENNYGNFKSWKQYRKFFAHENRNDERIVK
jgi:thymidylate synthase ThyX